MGMQAVYDSWNSLLEGLDRINEAEERAECMAGNFLGLDLGQAADSTALAILERQPRASSKEPGVYHCRHLQRWPLHTPYPSIVDDVFKIATSETLQRGVREVNARPDYEFSDENSFQTKSYARREHTPVLAVDATGVGLPVYDLFKVKFKEGRNGQSFRVVDGPARHKPYEVELRPILITGGDNVTKDGDLHKVPKRELVSSAQVALQTGRLQVSPKLQEAQTLTRELMNFKMKISLDTGHDSYGAWREGQHDDLVLAVCLALWIAENDKTSHLMWW